MISFYLLESFGKVCRGSTVTIMSHCLPFFNMMPEGGMKEQANRRSKNPLNDSGIISTSTKNQHITRRKQNASRNTSHRNNRNDRRPASSRSQQFSLCPHPLKLPGSLTQIFTLETHHRPQSYPRSDQVQSKSTDFSE